MSPLSDRGNLEYASGKVLVAGAVIPSDSTITPYVSTKESEK